MAYDRRSATNLVPSVSNELELCLYGVDAPDVIDSYNKTYGPRAVGEVNPRDLIEINVSMARSPGELNEMVRQYVSDLIGVVKSLNGQIYGGSSVLSNVLDVKPKKHRTTSMSNACGKGFLDIASHQIVMGVSDDKYGFALYNFFRKINPVLLALSASSPFRYENGTLVDTGMQSRRIQQYQELCRYFPDEMWKTMPQIESMEEYLTHLRNISDEINRRLRAEEMDADWDELNRVRIDANERPFSHYPFKVLEPHQLYWFIRPRPDHANEECKMSLELRVPDISTTVQGIQMLNSFVIGLAYGLVNYEPRAVLEKFSGSYEELLRVSHSGTATRVDGTTLEKATRDLLDVSVAGLGENGLYLEASQLQNSVNRLLEDGNDSVRVRRAFAEGVDTPEKLRTHLAGELERSANEVTVAKL